MRKKQKIISLYKDNSIENIKHVISVGCEEGLNKCWDFFLNIEDLNQSRITSFMEILFSFVLAKIQKDINFFSDIIVEKGNSHIYLTIWNKSTINTLDKILKKESIKYKQDDKRITIRFPRFTKKIEVIQEKIILEDEPFNEKSVSDIIQKVHIEVDKISAEDFFKDIHIDQEILDEMNELESDMENLLYLDQLTDEHKDQLISFFASYSKILNSLIEFKELAYAITLLNTNIINYSIENEMLSVLMLHIISDLIEWKKNIFVEQTVENIHYMDDSFISNIKQIDLIFNNVVDEEDDTEFF